MSINPDRREAALDWLVRTNDPEFDGWDQFTAWLEESPANADAYHALAGSEAELLPLIQSIPPEPQPTERPDRRRLALVAGLAALAAAGAAVIAPRRSA